MDAVAHIVWVKKESQLPKPHLHCFVASIYLWPVKRISFKYLNELNADSERTNQRGSKLRHWTSDRRVGRSLLDKHREARREWRFAPSGTAVVRGKGWVGRIEYEDRHLRRRSRSVVRASFHWRSSRRCEGGHRLDQIPTDLNWGHHDDGGIDHTWIHEDWWSSWVDKKMALIWKYWDLFGLNPDNLENKEQQVCVWLAAQQVFCAPRVTVKA